MSRNTEVSVSPKQVLEETLEILNADSSFRLVTAMMERISRFETRVGLDNLTARYRNTLSNRDACMIIHDCLHIQTGIAEWDENPNRTHVERIAVLRQAIAKARAR